MVKLLLLSAFLGVSSIAGLVPTRTDSEQTQLEKKNLCYGYNITAGIPLYGETPLLVTNPIIDLNSDYLDHVAKINSSTTTTLSYTASTLFDLNMKFSTGIGYDTSAGVGSSKIGRANTDLSVAFKLDTGLSMVKKEKFEVYSTILKNHSYVIQGLRVADIKNYLSPNFVSDIKAVTSKDDAKSFFQTYGTHLNTGYTYGGLMNFTEYTVTNDLHIDLNQSLSLQKKMELTSDAISSGNGLSFDEDFQMSLESSTTRTTFSQKNYGGENFTGFSVAQLFTYQPSLFGVDQGGYYYQKWVNSVNAGENLHIVEIPYGSGAKSVPVWNLLPNVDNASSIRKYFIDAFLEVAGDKYEEYLSKYKMSPRSLSLDDDEDTQTSTIGNMYIKTPGGYFYAVESSDVAANGKHGELHNGDTLYLNLNHRTQLENISFDVNGSQNVDLIDVKRGIFKINGPVNQQAIISLKYKEGNAYKRSTLLEATIKQSYYEGGVGNETYPYIIASPEQFANISKNSTKNYVIMEDLDFTGIAYKPQSSFKGVLNGNYCQIKNLALTSNEDADKERCGIFASNEGTIKNLVIKNSGSSTNDNSWRAGGIDLKNGYNNDAFKTNSISSKKAGVLCGENTGTISNVYLEDCFLRNIAADLAAEEIDNKKYYDSFTGAICGLNTGVIELSMIKNVRILAMLESNSEAGSKYSSYTGGLVGKTIGGTIKNSVVDLDSYGYVLNKLYLKGDKKPGSADVASNALIGYVETTSEKRVTISSIYAYVRSDSVVVSMTSSTVTQSTTHIYVLSSFVLSTKDNKNYSISNIIISATEVDKGLKNDPRVGLSNDGTISFNGNSEKVSDLITNAKINESNIYDEYGFDRTYFMYDSSSNSGIKHLLASPRSEYMSYILNVNDYDFYQEEYFSLTNIEIKRYITGVSNPETVTIFRLIDESGKNLTSDPLNELGSNNLRVALYGGQSDTISNKVFEISVLKNDIQNIFINTDGDAYIEEINYDDRQDYLDNFSINSVDVWATLTNGKKVKLDENSDYIKNAKLTITNVSREDELVEGDNVITVQYGNASKKTNTVDFLLHCTKYDVDSISIKNQPNKTVYKAGETFDPKGMVVEVTYDGLDNKKEISGIDLNKLEYTGDIISAGENEIVITYEDYGPQASVFVTGEANEEFLYEVTLDKSSVSLFEGETVQLSATAKENGVVVSNPELTFTSSNPEVATVSSTGLVTAVSEGSAEITVKFNGESAICMVTVRNNPVPEDANLISIYVEGGKREFTVGDTFTTDGLLVFGVYDNGVEARIKLNDCTISNPDMYTAGKKVVTVTYGDFSTTYEITVSEKSVTPVENAVLESVEINDLPDKIRFNKGEQFTSEGLTLLAKYSDGSFKVVQPTKVREPNMKLVGEQEVTVSYTENSITKNASYKITIDGTSGGCGGSVIAASAVLSISALIGFSLLLIKKKKEQ